MNRIEVENNHDCTVSVQVSATAITNYAGTHRGPDEIVLLIEDENGDHIATFTPEQAAKLTQAIHDNVVVIASNKEIYPRRIAQITEDYIDTQGPYCGEVVTYRHIREPRKDMIRQDENFIRTHGCDSFDRWFELYPMLKGVEWIDVKDIPGILEESERIMTEKMLHAQKAESNKTE